MPRAARRLLGRRTAMDAFAPEVAVLIARGDAGINDILSDALALEATTMFPEMAWLDGHYGLVLRKFELSPLAALPLLQRDSQRAACLQMPVSIETVNCC